jgi:sigma-B regulation protein RsbU (phosphoserine phosphatase)
MAYLLIPDKRQIRKVPIKKASFFVGRARENDLIIPSDSLSRFHAQINQKDNQFVINDRGSLNGVFVNGVRIYGDKTLNDGDIVGFGTVYVRFVMENEKLLKDKKDPEKLQRFPVEKLMDSRNFQPEKSQRYLEFLYGFTQKLLQQLPTSDLGEVAQELIHDVWNPDRSCLMLRESTGEWLISTQRFGSNPQLTGDTMQISTSLIRELEKNEEALLVSNRTEDERFNASESLQRQNISSVMCAPLWNNSKIHGFLYADLILSWRGFSYGDLEMFAILANLLAMKWENDQLWQQALVQQQMEQELNLAGEIQRKFFPALPPEVAGVDVHGFTIPTRKVGGDAYFWHHRQDGRLVLMIADVMGKGFPSALLMSQVQAIMKIYSEQYSSARQIVIAINDFIFRFSTQDRFISMVVMVLDPGTGRAIFCNAGHNPPFILDVEGKHRLLEDGGMPVGVFLDQSYREGETVFAPGETLVFYTDGITEARNKDEEEFGLDRLIETALENRNSNSRSLEEAILHKIREDWLGTDQEDDWTLLIAKKG